MVGVTKLNSNLVNKSNFAPPIIDLSMYGSIQCWITFDNSQTTTLESIIHNCLYDIPILNPDTAKHLACLSYVF